MAAQFDIVENLDRVSRGAYPYLVILQHDHAESARTVVAAPLAPPPLNPVKPRLHPPITVDGRRHVIFVAQLAAISKAQVGKVVGTASSERDRIVAAIDMLFTGI